MRYTHNPEGDGFEVCLSETNLRALLGKLSIPGSACTIYGWDDQGNRYYIKAERDEVHYADRNRDIIGGARGRMSPETEAQLADPNSPAYG